MKGSRRSVQRDRPVSASLTTALLEAQDPVAADTDALSRSGRHRVTIALMIATAMQAFDSTIANVALPRLELGLGGGIDLGIWVMTSYLCASAVMAVMTGWFRRRFGARPVLGRAIGVFVLASLLCAVASSPDELILFRLIQGAAAGIIQPLAQAILLDIYPKRDHGRMLAMLGATIMAGPMLGPVLGGLITDLASWRWIFALNAPLGAIAMFGLAWIPPDTAPTDKSTIDGVGIALLVVGVGSLQLALERSIGRLWPPSPETIAESTIAALALAAIAMRSRRSRITLLHLEVFRNLNFAASASYNFMIGALLFTTIVFVPALSEGPLGYDATSAGLIISPRGMGTMVTMLAVRWLINRVDHRALLAVGLALTASALELMAQVPRAGGGLWLAATSTAQGIGVGLLFTPLSTLAFSTLAAKLRTDAAGIYNLMRQLGCAAGVAIMTAVLQARILANLPGTVDRAAVSPQLLELSKFAAYTACFRTLSIVAAVLIPGVFLFHVLRPDRAAPTAV